MFSRCKSHRFTIWDGVSNGWSIPAADEAEGQVRAQRAPELVEVRRGERGRGVQRPEAPVPDGGAQIPLASGRNRWSRGFPTQTAPVKEDVKLVQKSVRPLDLPSDPWDTGSCLHMRALLNSGARGRYRYFQGLHFS